MSGIDVGLWDIKGKEAGMPVHELLCAPAAPPSCFTPTPQGMTSKPCGDDIQRYLDEGWPVIGCQLGNYGGGGFIEADKALRPRNAWPKKKAFDDEAYLEIIPNLFGLLRKRLGSVPS